MKQYASAPELSIDLAKKYTATVATNHGTIEISLDPERSPSTVNNFVFLARDGFYDGVICKWTSKSKPLEIAGRKSIATAGH